MTLQTRPWNILEHLDTEEEAYGFLDACVEEAPDDAAFIAHSLGVCARALGNLSKLSRDTGLTREGLYKSLSENGNPSFATILKVAGALGLQIAFVRKPGAAPRKAAAARRVKPAAAKRAAAKRAPAKKKASAPGKKTRRG